MNAFAKRGARRASSRAGRVVALGVLPTLAGYTIKCAQERVFDRFMAATPDPNITPARFSALTIIAENDELMQSDLAESLGIARSGAAAMMKALHDLGYVSQPAADTDRRAVHLALTPAGRIALETVTQAVRKQDDEHTALLSADERAVLMSLLKRISS